MAGKANGSRFRFWAKAVPLIVFQSFPQTEGFVVAPEPLIQTRIPLRLVACFIGFLLTLPVTGTDIPTKSTSDQPPRKVVVGTFMQPFWGKHPGLQKRLDQLTAIIDRMQGQSEKRYGRSLDLAILPEMALSGEGEQVGEVADWSFPLEGAVQETSLGKRVDAVVTSSYLIISSRVRGGTTLPSSNRPAKSSLR